MTLLDDVSHRRFNPLTREWVLVSPHRTRRPWLGQTERAARPAEQAYDPECYLCPGNRRANGEVNPRYPQTLVFPNDFPALQPDASGAAINDSGLIVAEPERGIAKVVCFSPRHDLTLARMSVDEIEPVVKVWTEEYRALGALEVAVDCYRRGLREPIPLFASLSCRLHENTATADDWEPFGQHGDGTDEANRLAFGALGFEDLCALPARVDDPPGTAVGRAARFADYLWDAIEESTEGLK